MDPGCGTDDPCLDDGFCVNILLTHSPPVTDGLTYLVIACRTLWFRVQSTTQATSDYSSTSTLERVKT